MTGTRLTTTIGDGGGNPFDAQYPKSVGLRGDVYVDALVLNGTVYGGGGGDNPNIVQLNSTDYWDGFSVRGGQYVDSLSLHSHEGHSVGAGGPGGDHGDTRSNIRIVSIGVAVTVISIG